MFDLNTLEFDKVLKQLEPLCFSRYAKSEITNLLPASNILDVSTLLNETAEAINILVKYGMIPLSNFEGVLEALNLAKKGANLLATDIVNVIILINNSLEINKYLNNIFQNSKDDYPNFENYNANLINLTKLRNLLTIAVGMDGNILDQASRNLFQIRRKLSLTENKLRQTLNQIMLANSNKLQELLITIRDNRMCLPVKIEYKNSFKGIMHDISSSNTTCYIEPDECFMIANELDNIKEEERVEINKILAELSLLINTNYEALYNNFTIITKLDMIFAKAKYSKEYTKPKLSTEYSFNLVNVCHPLINKDIVIPISIKMNKNDNIIIITGPNTGGKTVSLKTVGLLNLMVQAGIYPNSKKESCYYVFKNIRADIGDEQSIEESLSTFSSHITKIKDILAYDLEESLVLLDEVGSGTDPKEGSALAIAIIEYLKNKNAKAIITTHYTDLKNYAYETEGVINASVEFNSNTLKPTYKILLGVPGSSNAIDIATNLGLNRDVITKARTILANEPLNKDIINLENRLQDLSSKEELLEQEKLQIEELKFALTEEKNIIENERAKLLFKAKKEADEIINKAKADASDLLAKLKDVTKEIDVKDHVIADLKNKVNTLSSEEIKVNPFDEELKIDDFVKIIPYNKVGKIISINKDRYKVNFGQFTMDFKKKDLIKTIVQEKKEQRKTKLSGYNQVKGASLKLDLRGKRYEEVKDLLEDFIDRAVLANYESVNIVHGYGQGVIRNRVQELLKNNPNVKSYRYGGEGEGLNGATVVFLK